MKVAGVIIAGGRGSRLGGREKLLLPVGGALLIEHLLRKAERQVDLLALNVRRGTETHFAKWAAAGLPLFADPFDGTRGPVAGLVAALEWLAGLDSEFGWLATFPGDTPFLPHNLVAKLCAKAAGSRVPVVAFDGREIQSLCAIWPRESLAAVARGFTQGRYSSIRNVLDDLGSLQCGFPDEHGFFNVNSPEDHAEAERRALADHESVGA